MAFCSTGGNASALTDADEFLALVFADEQWLQAEFDAIIAASWPRPPHAHRPNAGVPRFASRGRWTAGWSPKSRPGREMDTEAPARQRSPP
jgi:hypothetical protein